MLGTLWFTALFGKHDAIALGREGAPQAKMTPVFIAGPFVCGLVTCIASAILMRALRIDSYRDGLLFSLIIGLGYLAATTVNTGINLNMPRPIVYGVISGSYSFVAKSIDSIVLVTIR